MPRFASDSKHALSPRPLVEGKGKGQKEDCPTRPERAEAPSPGQRPGYYWHIQKRPVREKALKTLESFCPYWATLLIAFSTQGVALG